MFAATRANVCIKSPLVRRAVYALLLIRGIHNDFNSLVGSEATAGNELSTANWTAFHIAAWMVVVPRQSSAVVTNFDAGRQSLPRIAKRDCLIFFPRQNKLVFLATSSVAHFSFTESALCHLEILL